MCPTEIVGFAKLAPDFADRDANVPGGSTDNEFSKLGWRRDHQDLASLNHWQFADSTGSLVDQLGVRDAAEDAALAASIVGRCEFCVGARYKLLKGTDMSTQQLRDVGRIAAVVNAAAQVVAVEASAEERIAAQGNARRLSSGRTDRKSARAAATGGEH